MVPKRKISKGFRQRKVPNIELDTYCKALGDLENMAPYIPESHNTMQNQMTRETSRKQQIEKFRCLKEKIQKNNLTDIINTGAVKLVKTKMQPEQKKDCFLRNQKQPSQPNRKIISKNRTMQSEDNSLEKFVKVRADELNSSNKKTDLANQILKSIEASINSTCRSMSAMSKDKGKKRRMIDECKVVKVPWKSNKRQFKPEVSMIKKNSSRAPMDSLRQIYQNLN